MSSNQFIFGTYFSRFSLCLNMLIYKHKKIKWIILFILFYNLHFSLTILHKAFWVNNDPNPHPHGGVFPVAPSVQLEGSEGPQSPPEKHLIVPTSCAFKGLYCEGKE